MDSRIATSIAAQSGGALFNAVVSFALILVLARTLGDASFGEYVAVLGFAGLGLILIEGGWPTLVYRESVAAPGHDPARAANLARLAASHQWLTGGVLTTGALALPLPALPFALGCMTLVATMNLASARLRGAGLFGREAAWQMAGRAGSAAAIVVALWLVGADARWVFLAWAVGLAVVLATNTRGWVPVPRGIPSRAAYALALPFMAIEGLSTLMFRSDVALLKLFDAAPAALSHYAACTRFNEAALLLCAPMTNVLLRASRQRRDDAPAFARLNRGAFFTAASAGIVLWLGSLMFGEPLMQTLFGAGFRPAGLLLPWTALALVFALPSLVAVQALVARGDEHRLMHALGVGAVVLVAAMGVGATRNGPTGAALGLAGAHFVLLVATLLALRRSPART